MLNITLRVFSKYNNLNERRIFYGCRQQLIVSGFFLKKNPSLLSTKTLPYVGRRTTCIYLSVYGSVWCGQQTWTAQMPVPRRDAGEVQWTMRKSV